MAEGPTCGQGLAERAVVPAKLGEVIGALAENLEAHLRSLDPADEEHRAYVSLAEQARTITAQLRAMAAEMAGYRELPMARHDEEALSSPRAVRAFEGFVLAEQELLALVEEAVGRDREMLGQMGGAAPGETAP